MHRIISAGFWVRKYMYRPMTSIRDLRMDWPVNSIGDAVASHQFLLLRSYFWNEMNIGGVWRVCRCIQYYGSLFFMRNSKGQPACWTNYEHRGRDALFWRQLSFDRTTLSSRRAAPGRAQLLAAKSSSTIGGIQKVEQTAPLRDGPAAWAWDL